MRTLRILIKKSARIFHRLLTNREIQYVSVNILLSMKSLPK